MSKLTVVNAEKCGKKTGYLASEAYKPGEKVVVENETGLFYGVVSHEENFKEETQNMIVRRADYDDEKKYKQNKERLPDLLKTAKEKCEKLNCPMKLLDADMTLDGNKVIFYFSSDGRVDFRELVKQLASGLKARIELRQVGIRDEVKIMGGLGPCGEVCCCKRFLNDFASVSIKMAKTQNLSLNPNSINGLCGRLMCCLSYENDYYAETAKRMPKIHSMVDTPKGKGTAAYTDFLKEQVTVKFTDGDAFSYEDFNLKDIKVTTYAKVE